MLYCALGLLASMEHATAFKLKVHGRNRDDADSDVNVQIENIYGIPSDTEKLQMEAKKM